MTPTLFPDTPTIKPPTRWPYEEVSQRLQAARMAHHWSQEDLALMASLDVETVRDIEKKKHIPRGDTLIFLCEALDVSPWWLVGKCGSRYAPMKPEQRT